MTWLGEYHPYWGGSNPRHYEQHSQAIFKLKLYNVFSHYLKGLIAANLQTVVKQYGKVDVMIIPSHDPARRNNRYIGFIRQIVADIPKAVILDNFKRSKLAPKLTGNSAARHPNTLIDTCKIEGDRTADTVVLFDDVITSGSSMVGGNALLKLHGYKHVICIAFGRTVT